MRIRNKKKKNIPTGIANRAQAESQPGRAKPQGELDETGSNFSRWRFEPSRQNIWGGLFVIAFVWTYWPTITGLVERWSSVADYSHGFLVAPLAALFLLVRRKDCPRDLVGSPKWAIVAVTIAMVGRYLSARLFLPSLDGWTIPVWLAGISLWYGGFPLLRWCLPSLVFLLFMVPLPYTAERAMGLPLRRVAAVTSCWLLQCLRQPAVEEGTTILMNDQDFDVAHECSGLRMLMGIIALAMAYVMFTRKPWWQKTLLFLSAVPVAVAANVVRITVTALLFEHISTSAGKRFSHDAAGLVTNCVAAFLLAIVLWILSRIFEEYEVLDRPALVKSDKLPGLAR